MQNFLGTLSQFYDNATGLFGMPDISFSFVDIVEILIISFLFYHILLWIKNTRAWNLFKGIIVILLFVLVAAIFQMNTILWLAENTLSVGLTALVIIFQPELRKALENLGGKNVLGKLFDFGKVEENKFSDHTIDELIKACYAMGKVKTGALIVIEDEILLNEYVRTGIDIDAIISSQLLINIFEKNTPLHDGAVIVRGDRVVSATCYLPLSDRRCPSPREMRWIRLMHCRHTVLMLSAGISIRHLHHGFQRDSPVSLCSKVSVNLWERSGTPMHSSCFTQILINLMPQNTNWNMINYRLWIDGFFPSLIPQ